MEVPLVQGALPQGPRVLSIYLFYQTYSSLFRVEADFLAFSNMLMNDAIFLLDESLAKLHHIHEVEELFDSPQCVDFY